MKAAIRRDHCRRRLREKHQQKGYLSASYLEPDKELESDEDIGSMKKSVVRAVQHQMASSSSDSEGEGVERLLKAKEEQQEGETNHRLVAILDHVWRIMRAWIYKFSITIIKKFVHCHMEEGV